MTLLRDRRPRPVSRPMGSVQSRERIVTSKVMIRPSGRNLTISRYGSGWVAHRVISVITATQNASVQALRSLRSPGSGICAPSVTSMRMLGALFIRGFLLCQVPADARCPRAPRWPCRVRRAAGRAKRGPYQTGGRGADSPAGKNRNRTISEGGYGVYLPIHVSTICLSRPFAFTALMPSLIFLTRSVSDLRTAKP